MIFFCAEINRDDIKLDPSGWYFLIRCNFQYGYIEVAACHKDVVSPEFMFQEYVKHVKEIFRGRCAQDIYHEILEKREYVTSLTHAAYLGKEIKKAEIALALGIKGHYQE